MVFAIVSLGIHTKPDLLNLLNDLRNINEHAFVLINYDLDLNFYHFTNVTLIKTEDKNWTCFKRYFLLEYIFTHTDHQLLYVLDCDSRYVDFRDSKYNRENYINLMNKIDFDLMYTWDLKGPNGVNSVGSHLQPPSIGENKDVRQFQFGHKEVLDYLNNKIPNLLEYFDLGTPLESALMVKRSDNVISFLNSLIEFGNVVEQADKSFGRIHCACSSSYAISLFGNFHNIKLNKNFIPGHYFKPNFTKEMYLWGMNMNPNFKIY